MQKRNYYRAGWLKFDNEADMANVIDKLSDEKVCHDFLHFFVAGLLTRVYKDRRLQVARHP